MTTVGKAVVAHDFDAAAANWEAAYQQKRDATVFDSLAWNRVWWRHFGAGAELLVAMADSAPPASPVIAPMMRRGNVVSFLGGTDLVDYHQFITSDFASQEQVSCVLEAVCGGVTCQRVELLSLPEGSAAAVHGASCLERLGWEVQVSEEDVAPRLVLPASWDGYLEGLSKKDRHELRRKMRRIEGAGAVQDIELRERAQIDGAMGDFLRLHRLSSPDKTSFMTPEREAFFRDMAGSLAVNQMARLRFLELDGRKVASSLSFVVNGVRYLYNSGYDPAYRDYAVGLMNHAYTIKASIAEGHRILDFMRGNEPYKYSLGATDRKLWRVVATRGQS